PVQPEAVEVVGDVVVMADGSLITPAAVADRNISKRPCNTAEQRRRADALRKLDANTDDVLDFAVGGELAADVGVSKPDEISRHQRPNEASRSERDGHGRTGRESKRLAVPEHHP